MPPNVKGRRGSINETFCCVRHVTRYLTLVLIAGMFLQGCSTVRVGYGNADNLARWWIDHYVAMSPEQDALARERLDRVHAWHRKTQLPEYVSFLRQAQKLFAGQPTADDALILGEGMIRFGRKLAEQAIPDIADLVATATPAQIELMASRLAEKNADYAREAQLAEGEGGQRKARYKRLLERAEYWFGDFNDEQKSTLRQMIDTQSAGSQFWYEERLRRQREWLALVRQIQRERPLREHVVQTLRDYAARFDLPRDPVRLSQAQALRRASAELAVAIHAMTTPTQRDYAHHKLGDLMHDFAELSEAH
jgi:hypothetical protein